MNKGETAKSRIVFAGREQDLISKVFQNYYCEGIYEIAEEDETAKSIFEKVGLLESED